MALKFLSDIDVSGALELNGNSLKNARLQNASSNPTGPAAGQIYYNSSDNEIRFYNGTSWINLSSATGDITGVTAGNGLTGGGNSGAVTLDVVGGTGITANANDVALDTATASTLGGVKIGSGITITSGVISADQQTETDFTATLADKLENIEANATATSAPAISSNGSTPSLASGITAAEVRSLIGAGTGNGSSNLALGTTSSTALAGNTTTITSGQASAITANTAKTGITSAQANAIAANTLKVTNTDVNVNTSNLASRLGELGGTTTIGSDAASDTIVVRGNLTVQGTTTTINSNTLSTGDNVILLNNDVTGTPTQDAGLEVERGTGTNVKFQWDESSDRWQFTNDGSTFYNIPISSEYSANSGDITGVTVTAGDGLTGGGSATSGAYSETLNVVGGTGITANADNISLDTATASALGGVKIGSRITIASGVISADVQTANDFTTTLKNKLDGIASSANNYSLPTETASVLGGVKVGSNLTISNGVLSGTANTQRSNEEIRDLVADVMVGNATHTGISAVDDDSGNGVDLVNAYNHYSATYTNATSISVGGDTMQIGFPANITLYDSAGKVVYAETEQNTSSGDLSITGLPSGTYYLSVMGSRP